MEIETCTFVQLLHIIESMPAAWCLVSEMRTHSNDKITLFHNRIIIATIEAVSARFCIGREELLIGTYFRIVEFESQLLFECLEHQCFFVSDRRIKAQGLCFFQSFHCFGKSIRVFLGATVFKIIGKSGRTIKRSIVPLIGDSVYLGGSVCDRGRLHLIVDLEPVTGVGRHRWNAYQIPGIGGILKIPTDQCAHWTDSDTFTTVTTVGLICTIAGHDKRFL